MEGSSYTGRRLVAVAPAVPVEVREVPVPRPATFCGGIGNYRLAASASPTSLRVGDPLTLTLDIERGPSQRIAGPDLGAGPRGKSPDRRRFRDPRQESHRAQRGRSEAIRVCPATEAGRSRDSRPGRHGIQSRYRKVLGDRDQADRARRIGGQSPGRGRPCRVALRFRDTGDQVAGTGDFSKRDRSFGTERSSASTSSRWPR